MAEYSIFSNGVNIPNGDGKRSWLARTLEGTLADVASRDAHITLPPPAEGERNAMPIYRWIERILGNDGKRVLDSGLSVRLHDASRDPALVERTLRESIDAAQRRHIKGSENAAQAASNLTTTISGVRQQLK